MNIDKINELTKQAYDKTALKYYNNFARIRRPNGSLKSYDFLFFQEL